MFSADKNHLHHRLVAKGLSQRQAVFTIYSLAVLAALVGVIVDVKRYFYFGVMVVGFLMLLGIVISFGGLLRIKKSIAVGKTYNEIAPSREGKTYINS